jgi:hypothetical protein
MNARNIQSLNGRKLTRSFTQVASTKKPIISSKPKAAEDD